jgi:hypothetical protein
MRLTFAAAMVFVLGCGGTTPPTDAATPPTDAATTDGATPPTDGATPPTDGATPTTDGADGAADGAAPDAAVGATAFRGTRAVSIGGVTVDVLIDKPVGDSLDALVVYHGSVGQDSMVPAATATTLAQFRGLLDRDDVMLVSVAYPEQGRPFGDNLREAEAGLRWVREVAAAELGITLRRVFLGGHSQGGYLVTRLNTMHAVDGVVANAPGPLDLVYRCGLEERGQTTPSAPCNLLRGAFGTTTANPEAYASRSLLRFTSPQRSRVLMVQGLADDAIQLRSWPMFREQLERCADCRERTFLEIPGRTHPALFMAPEGRAAFNTFLR